MGDDYRSAYKKGRAGQLPETAAGRIRKIRGQNSEGGTRLPDYSVYRLSVKETVRYGAAYLLLDGCVSYLFFCSRIAFFLLFPGIFLFLRDRKKSLRKKREEELRGQFLDGVQMMAASLQAGYSVENSVREALRELRKMYEQEDYIIREFRLIETQMGMSRSLEELFLDFGRRSGVEDILSFAEVFQTARRSGGDLLAIIRNTVSCIRQKRETLQEIETCLAGKAMEQNIMSVIPIFILAYIRLTSPEFLEVMYGNVTGMSVMGLCFAVYVAAYLWGRKIVRIEV